MGHKLCGCFRLATLSPGALREWSWRVRGDTTSPGSASSSVCSSSVCAAPGSTSAERSRGSSRWKPGPGISGELPGGALQAGSRDHTKVPGRRADTSPDMACGAVRDRPTGKTGAGRIVLPVPRKGKPVATRGRKASALPRVPRAGRTAAEGRHADMPLTFARLPLRHFSSITLRRFMTTQELVQQEKLMRLSERCVAEIHRTKNEDIRSTLTMALTAINEAWFHLETKTESRVPQS